ncbi:reverse transcriptase (RNA-dependent DNA polymerase) [Chitinophaga dinghuensis]|uniref:Reverse transcriptase (RNA-dependent DNA polymerase) n=1 Tax=Chitinophaga dinghuensis TaxID=1539050 RepID=A0A327VZS9_9BACT|nr:reverse transcriptase domain-containing protein [Chitinophaga dinghuensis]RAJ80264.1 reverse transcriptase (RNA-dependent DNA polymerase) [Chitinophaga dinghuensis]
MENSKPEWLKAKGYLHLTAQIDVNKGAKKIIDRIQAPSFIKKYSFYPLIHTVIKERRYKKDNNGKRCHKYKKGNVVKRTAKSRPLHYATHMDAIIFGYYASLIQEKYELSLSKSTELNSSVTAYRKIPTEVPGKYKGTIHFAKEVFDEVRIKTKEWGECAVLAFDIESFFSTLNHDRLEKAWKDLFHFEELRADHKKVFQATTKFSYVLLKDLKKIQNKSSSNPKTFNEKRLAKIRNHFGKFSFFESNKEFREAIKTRLLPIYKNNFRDKGTKEVIGIPQGLPISAVLANLYLLEFDKRIVEEAVMGLGAFYRRYSDDIIVICPVETIEKIKDLVKKSLSECLVNLSLPKTEVFKYTLFSTNELKNNILCSKIKDGQVTPNSRLTYLGFEFDGNRTFIKSANLSRFYRRMMRAVRSKARLAIKLAEPGVKPVIFIRQLYDLYSKYPLTQKVREKKYKKLVRNGLGEYRMVVEKRKRDRIPEDTKDTLNTYESRKDNKRMAKSNYWTYVDRASEIMQEPAISKQLKNQTKILTKAIAFRLKLK